MKKYVVTWEEEIIVICKTRADAEEYVFSEVEEITYETFLDDARYWENDSWEPDFFFNGMRLDFEYENRWRMNYNHPRQLKSLYAYILNCNSSGWYIQEVEELE